MGRQRFHRVAPGASNLIKAVTDFVKRGPCTVSSLSDARLRTLRHAVGSDAEVQWVPFGDLVGRSLQLVGRLPRPMAADIQVRAAIASACAELAEDSPFFATRERTGLHKAIQTALHELSDWGLEDDELEQLIPSLPPSSQRKYRDLAAIARQVRETLAQINRGSKADRIRECLASQSEYFGSLGRVMVLANGEFSPLEAAWLRWSELVCDEIVVIHDDSRWREGMFLPAEMMRIALGFPEKESGAVNRLASVLFTDETVEAPGFPTEIWSAPDQLAEAEWVLRRCSRELDEGVVFADMAIVSRVREDAVPLVTAAALRHETPVELSNRVRLDANGFVRLLLSVIGACAGTDVRELEPISRSSYLGHSHAAQAELSTILRSAYRAGDASWSVLQTWVEQNRETFRWLNQVVAWRAAVVAHPAPLSHWADRLRELGAFEWHAASIEQRHPTSARDSRAQSALQRTFVNMASVQGIVTNRNVDLAEFHERLVELCEHEDSSVPDERTGVPFVSSSAELGQVDLLFVTGMLEGRFPRRRREDPILFDAEKEALSHFLQRHSWLKEFLADPLALRMFDSHDAARKERDEFVQLVASAKNRIIFSYPKADDDRDNVPAYYLQEIRRASGGMVTLREYSRSTLVPPIGECVTIADQRLARQLALGARRHMPNELTTESAKELARIDVERGISPTQVRRALQCPFRATVGAVVQLDDPATRSTWGEMQGIIGEAGIAREKDLSAAREAILATIQVRLEELIGGAEAWDLALTRAALPRIVDDAIMREERAREIWRHDPDTVRIRVPFEEAGEQQGRLPKVLERTPRLKGFLGAVSRRGDIPVAHLYTARPWDIRRDIGPENVADALRVALPALAVWQKHRPRPVIEVDSLEGGRRLFVFGRDDDDWINDTQLGLDVCDLGPAEPFMRVVRDAIEQAVKVFIQPEVAAVPGDYCSFCRLGELCRRSQDFGEFEATPFVGDVNE